MAASHSMTYTTRQRATARTVVRITGIGHHLHHRHPITLHPAIAFDVRTTLPAGCHVAQLVICVERRTISLAPVMSLPLRHIAVHQMQTPTAPIEVKIPPHDVLLYCQLRLSLAQVPPRLYRALIFLPRQHPVPTPSMCTSTVTVACASMTEV